MFLKVVALAVEENLFPVISTLLFVLTETKDIPVALSRLVPNNVTTSVGDPFPLFKEIPVIIGA